MENDEKFFKFLDIERKRWEVIWELFISECVFFIDYLMVLKYVSFVVFMMGKLIVIKIYEIFVIKILFKIN